MCGRGTDWAASKTRRKIARAKVRRRARLNRRFMARSPSIRPVTGRYYWEAQLLEVTNRLSTASGHCSGWQRRASRRTWTHLVFDGVRFTGSGRGCRSPVPALPWLGIFAAKGSSSKVRWSRRPSLGWDKDTSHRAHSARTNATTHIRYCSSGPLEPLESTACSWLASPALNACF